MIGELCAKPGMDARHRMFSPLSTSQWTGAAPLASTPLASGPRNCGQLAASELVTTKKVAIAASPHRLSDADSRTVFPPVALPPRPIGWGYLLSVAQIFNLLYR